jgi:shikimate dehydrogenase
VSAATAPDRRSLLTGLLGRGVGPSLTPELHEREGQRHGLRYVYKTVELTGDTVAPDYLRRLLAAAVHLGFDGLNVTHPVKQVMVPLVDRLAPEAAVIGALNTVLIAGGVTVGHNTDVTGFAHAVRDGLPGAALDHVVLLGAGGAGAAVAHALLGLGADRLDVVDPDLPRAERLAADLVAGRPGLRVAAVVPDDVAVLVAAASGVVNATPIGMTGHPGTPIAPELIRADQWVVDIVYRPVETAFLRAARDRGCRVLSGAGMAVHQAADTFELVTGLPADRRAMFADFDDLVAREVAPPDRTDERNS